MAKGINIAIGADTRAFDQAINRGLIDPTEEAAKALEDFGRNGPRDIERVEDAMQDAQRETEDVKGELQELAREIRSTGAKAKTDFSDKYKGAADDTSAAFEQVKDDGFSNAKEVAASFDGSAESIVEGFQGAAAEAFSGFGPAGAIAGLAAAAGIGLITAELTKQQEEAEATKQALIDMYKDAVNEGRSYIDEMEILDRATELRFDDEKMKQYHRTATELGIDVNTVILAQAGSYEAVREVQETVIRKVEDLESVQSFASQEAKVANENQVLQLQEIDREYGTLAQTHQKNQDLAEEAVKLQEQRAAREREQIARTRSADEERYTAAARRYGVDLPTAVVPVTADTRSADEALKRLIEKPRRLKIDIEGRLANGQRVI